MNRVKWTELTLSLRVIFQNLKKSSQTFTIEPVSTFFQTNGNTMAHSIYLQCLYGLKSFLTADFERTYLAFFQEKTGLGSENKKAFTYSSHHIAQNGVN